MNFRLATLALLFIATLGTVSADPVVRAAQIRLQELGYFDFTIDGAWGPRTAAAVSRYQSDQDLEITATLTSSTLSSLRIRVETRDSRSRRTARPTPTPLPLYQAIPDVFKGGPYLNAPTAYQIRVITAAQKNLRTLGYYACPLDGNPGPALTRAIVDYQRSADFRATGRLDKSTLQGLDLLYLDR